MSATNRLMEMPEQDIQQIADFVTKDPHEARLRGLQIKKTERELGQAEVKEIAGGLATYNDQTKKWEWTLPPKPTAWTQCFKSI